MNRAFSLPEAMWWAFRAGQSHELVRKWMDAARKGCGPEHVAMCVSYARTEHRQYCRYLSQAMAAHGERA